MNIDVVPHLPMLRRYASSLVWAQEVDDLVNETIVKALTKQHLFSEISLEGWLLRLMHNVYVDEVRRVKRQNTRPSPMDESDENVLGLMDVDRTSSVMDLHEVIKKMETIPTIFRDAVVEEALGDSTYAERSATLNVPVQTLWWRVHRGRQMLRELCT